jgi:amidophosphoribosyltransferase
MSDSIKHECGIAFLRLKKPLSFYKEKYGTYLYGLNKLYLLMEKQHNRGQDGAGAAVIKLNVQPGNPYIFRNRSDQSNPIPKVFEGIHDEIIASGFISAEGEENPDLLETAPFAGELFLGHLRYGTYGRGGLQFVHPFIRQNNWMSRNLVLAGNFNMTNNDALFNRLIELGQHPLNRTDTVTVLERIGHALDEENDVIFKKLKEKGVSKKDISKRIAEEINIENALKKAAADFDGGYTIAGLVGHGDAFVLRDPNGIRPAFWYENDEMLVVTSERPPIKTAFDFVDYNDIKEIEPGQALIIKRDGKVNHTRILPSAEKTSCSFERIYFSRGTDRDIYKERKELGKLITPAILESVNYDLENTVFSFIPNTAEVAFLGMMEAVNTWVNDFKKTEILKGGHNDAQLDKLLSIQPRSERIAVKDAKLRTFITSDSQRKDLVSHVYDTTYGVIRNHTDTLIAVDDSIVRGTTLRNSILRILDRLKPKKIIIVSSAPQIRYPDCYGIDMSKLKDFIAFRAAIELLKETGRESVIEEVYTLCKKNIDSPDAENFVKKIYEPFSDTEISKKIGGMLKTSAINAEVEIIYQTVENLHKACPDNKGDWYFTGNFPTAGGRQVVNRSFINYYEGSDARAY